MSAMRRTARILSTAAAAGLLIFGATGCGAMKESKDEAASASPSSEAASSASPSSSGNSNSSDGASDSGGETPGSGDGATTPSTDDTTPSSPSPAKPGQDPAGSGAPKGNLPALKGNPAELDPTPLTEGEKEKGKQMMADFLVGVATTGDFTALCDIAVFKDPAGELRRVDNKPEMREQCAQAVGQFAEAEQGGAAGGLGASEEQAKSMFNPAMFELKDNGDGSYALSMSGQPLGFNVVKIKDGGVRLEVSQMELSGQP